MRRYLLFLIGLSVAVLILSGCTAIQAASAEVETLRFEMAEEFTRFVFDPDIVSEEGFPAHGNPFITQGYLYPEGTLVDSDGVNPDGSPEFPDKVVGTWICRGWIIGDSMGSDGSPAAISTQFFQLGDEYGNRTIVTEGYEFMVPGTQWTHEAGADNLALYTQHIGVLGSVEDQIVSCFSEGGGVPYQAFHRFHEVMAEDSYVDIVEPLLDEILPLAPGLIGQLEAGIEVLDVGCGRGHAMKRLAQTFPNSRFAGLDFSQEAIVVAQEDAQQMGLDNLCFMVQDAATLDQSNRYDLIFTFDAVHDQAQPARVLRNIYRAL